MAFKFKHSVKLCTAALITVVASSYAMANVSVAKRDTILVASMKAAPSFIPEHRLAPNNDIVTPFVAESNEHSMKAALKFVRKTGLNKNLSLLLLDAMKKDGLVLSAIKNKGFKTVKGIVVNAIVAEQKEHVEAWDQVLAQAYGKYFSETELLSLSRQKEKSPYFSRLISLQNEITATINKNGYSILRKAEQSVKVRVAEALGT